MEQHIIYIFIALGILEIVYSEKIFYFFRNFFNKYFRYSFITKLINGKSCLSFWIGFLFGICYYDCLLSGLGGGIALLFITKAIYFSLKFDKFDNK